MYSEGPAIRIEKVEVEGGLLMPAATTTFRAPHPEKGRSQSKPDWRWERGVRYLHIWSVCKAHGFSVKGGGREGMGNRGGGNALDGTGRTTDERQDPCVTSYHPGVDIGPALSRRRRSSGTNTTRHTHRETQIFPLTK